MNEHIESLAELLDHGGRVAVLTGAGCSTDSGIPDYRDDEGEWKNARPVMYADFMEQGAVRQRYWARSLFGWPSFAAARPNDAHEALAKLNQQWRPLPDITQNVDGLHQAAGHEPVIELHGNLHTVECLDCGQQSERRVLQERLRDANAELLGRDVEPAPDGDADLELETFARVRVPTCERCDGLLKPTVVFFGDAVAKTVVTRCFEAVEEADALLIVGSSVMIHSSFRFCRAAREQGKPLVALNIGQTRADDWLSAKYELRCEALLPRIAERLAPAVV